MTNLPLPKQLLMIVSINSLENIIIVNYVLMLLKEKLYLAIVQNINFGYLLSNGSYFPGNMMVYLKTRAISKKEKHMGFDI